MTGPLEALRADPEFSACFDRLATAIQGQGGTAADPGTALCGPQSPLEDYARAVSGASSPGVSLALTLPLALTVGTVAGQGAYWARLPLPGGDALAVPMIIQSTLIAPSGYGKSTSLDPLVRLVDRLDRAGHHRRTALCVKDRAAALAAVQGFGLAAAEAEAEQARLTKIYASGTCTAGLTLDSSTPEGVRRHLMNSGSCAGILTAEPDILQEISRYSKDGGTFRWLLDGWSGAKVGVARASGSVIVPRACLPYCILLQPVAFEQFNATQLEQGGGGIAADSAIGRGLYGRSWLVRVEGFAGVGQAYGLPEEQGAPGAGAVGGVPGALLGVEDSLEKMIIRAEPYRVRMGLAMGWEEAIGSGDAGVSKPQGYPEQLWLELAPDAWWPFVQCQNIRLALIELVQQLEVAAAGAERLLMPMATRWTEHVVRIALVLALSVDAATVDIPGWAVRDACLRICPWLLEYWAVEIYRYREAATVALLESEIKSNPRGENLTFQGRIGKAVRELAEEQVRLGVGEDDVLLGQGEVVRCAKEQVRRQARPELTNGLNAAFAEMVGKGWFSEVVVAAKGGKGGKPVKRYKRTHLGRVAGGL